LAFTLAEAGLVTSLVWMAAASWILAHFSVEERGGLEGPMVLMVPVILLVFSLAVLGSLWAHNKALNAHIQTLRGSSRAWRIFNRTTHGVLLAGFAFLAAAVPLMMTSLEPARNGAEHSFRTLNYFLHESGLTPESPTDPAFTAAGWLKPEAQATRCAKANVLGDLMTHEAVTAGGLLDVASAKVALSLRLRAGCMPEPAYRADMKAMDTRILAQASATHVLSVLPERLSHNKNAWIVLRPTSEKVCVDLAMRRLHDQQQAADAAGIASYCAQATSGPTLASGVDFQLPANWASAAFKN
jgi:hypothetical protein